MDNVSFEQLIYLAQHGDEDAKNKLVLENTSLVWALVHRFKFSSYDKEELFQIGCIGLIKAINKFDCSFHVTLSTYAVPIILGEIKRHFRDDGTIKVSRSIKDLYQKIVSVSDTYLIKNHQEISLEELANSLQVEKSDIILALDSKYYPTSLNEVIYERDGSEITVEERVEDIQTFSLIDKITLKDEIAKLSKKEQELIRMRYYLDLRQDEVAKRFKISQVQVSRMEKKIIEKLKKQFI